MRKLVEVIQNSATSKTYSLRVVFVNPEFVVKVGLRKGNLPFLSIRFQGCWVLKNVLQIRLQSPKY